MFQNKNLSVLESNLLFRGLDDTVAGSIFNSKNFSAIKEGEVIFQAGDESKFLYLILQGEVKLKYSGTKGIGASFKRVKNEFFGEQELLDQTTRITSAVADTDSVLYQLDKEELFQLTTKHKIILKNLSFDSMKEIEEGIVQESLDIEEPQNEIKSPKGKFENHEDEMQEEIIMDKELSETAFEPPNIEELHDPPDENYFSFSQKNADIEDLNFNNNFNPGGNHYEEKSAEDILDSPIHNNGTNDELAKPPSEYLEEKNHLSENDELIPAITDFENIPQKPEKFDLSDNNTFSIDNNSLNNPYQTEVLNLIEGVQKFLRSNIIFPVGEIKKYAAYLKKDSAAIDAELANNQIIKQADLVIALIQSTLELVTGNSSFNPSHQSVEKIMDEILSLLSEYVETRNIKLYKKTDAKTFLNADKEKLYCAFFQIAKNACDSMPEGGNLFVTVSNKDNNIIIEFTDEGPGIPSSLAFEVFEPLITHGRKDGTGLGLSIAKKIIRDHNGDITIDGELGEGTKIIITLPAQS